MKAISNQVKENLGWPKKKTVYQKKNLKLNKDVFLYG